MRLILTVILLFTVSGVFAQLFTEVSDEVGLTYIYPGNDQQEVGAGIVVLDVNNDGWDDIFQAGGIFPSKLWMNKQGKFVDVSKEWGITTIDELFIQGGSSADFDNDGYVDLFITNFGIEATRGDQKPPVLLRNIDGKRFERVYTDAFVKKGNYPGCVWGDVNNDGYVDLFLYNYVKSMSEGYDTSRRMKSYIPYCMENVFYVNNEGKGFERYDKQLGLDERGCGLAAAFSDYDNDNDVDLMLLNDFGEWNHIGNRLYRNEGSGFQLKDVSDSSGFYDEFYGMGVGPGDVNNDGFLDYYLTNIGSNRLLINDGTSFKNEADQRGVELPFEANHLKGTSWSGLFFDVENDGDVDLFVSKGYLESFENIALHEENKFFINDGTGYFEDISETSGVNDSLVQRGVGLLDYDHDGDLDIVCGVIKMRRSEFGSIDQKIKLYRNDNKEKNRWIGIRLEGSGDVNRSCIGCSVTFKAENATQIREVGGGTGHSSQQSKTLYFGLGRSKWARNIEIQWLGHETSVIKKLRAGKVYKIDREGTISVEY